MLTRPRRWTPERRAFAFGLLVRPAVLAAWLLLLWGHVCLVALVLRAASRGVPELLSSLFEAEGDQLAASLNAGLALLAVLFWVLVGVGFIQARSGVSKPNE